MAMAWIWTGMVVLSVGYAMVSGTIAEVGNAAMEGAAAAVDLCLGMLGGVCLWMGVMELLERSRRLDENMLRAYSKKAGPAIGGLLGAIPQCGISGAAASLFSTGSVTVGTMLAVFFATSDESCPSCSPPWVGTRASALRKFSA